MEILQQFGIEPKLLLVQLINFGILAIVVWKVILPRMTKLLDERRTGIAESLKGAEAARQAADQAAAERENQITETRQQAETIVAEARELATKERETIIAEAKVDADVLRQKQEAQLKADREKLRAELRAELAGLTIEATRKVLTGVVGAADREKMAKAAAAKLRGARRGH